MNINLTLNLTESNEWSFQIVKKINTALKVYESCKRANCSCYKDVIDKDLAPFKAGITREQFAFATPKGTKYQVRSQYKM